MSIQVNIKDIPSYVIYFLIKEQREGRRDTYYSTEFLLHKIFDHPAYNVQNINIKELDNILSSNDDLDSSIIFDNKKAYKLSYKFIQKINPDSY